MRRRVRAALVAATWCTIFVASAVALAGAPSSSSWRPLPRAPIAGRISASVVWTGHEVIVWGGTKKPGAEAAGPCNGCASDGAAYNPATRTWRRIARSPSGLIGGGGVAAWTGRAMVIVAGNSPDGPAAAAAYEPRTDTWRRLPSGPLGDREGDASVWTGHELLVFGGHHGDAIAKPTAAALDPRTGTWRTLRSLATVRLIASGAVWAAHEAFVTGEGTLIAYNPASDTVRRISLASAPVDAQQRSHLKAVAWTGEEVVFAASTDPLFSSTTIVRYNPSSGTWKTAQAAPCDLPAKTYTQIAWIGSRLVAACGTDGLQIYTPRTDTWQRITPGPSPLNSRGWGAIAWTGTELFAWSGTVHKPHNPFPASGATLALGR